MVPRIGLAGKELPGTSSKPDAIKQQHCQLEPFSSCGECGGTAQPRGLAEQSFYARDL